MGPFYNQLILIVIRFYLFRRNHLIKKYGRYLHSGMLAFLNISVTEAYVLKCDILVIALFAMFLSSSEMQAISFYYIVYQ